MAEKLRAANCAAHKEKHTRIVEREKAADQEKHVASASRKLRADKNFVESTSHTGSAGKLDGGRSARVRTPRTGRTRRR